MNPRPSRVPKRFASRFVAAHDARQTIRVAARLGEDSREMGSEPPFGFCPVSEVSVSGLPLYGVTVSTLRNLRVFL